MATSSVKSFNKTPGTFGASAHIATPSVTSLVARDNVNSLAVLPTALLLVYDASGTPQQCRALLDSGSMATFVTESLVQKLSLHRSHSKISVGGLASSEAGITKGKVTCTIASRFSSQNELVVNALILNKITAVVPTSFINLKNDFVEFAKALEFADSSFNEPLPIDMLIGADYFFDVITGQRLTFANTTFAQHTILSWVMSGKIETFKSDAKQCADSVISMHATLSLDQQLKRFWEIEDIPNQVILTSNEKRTENLFASTHSISSDGKISVLLPFKDEVSELGNSINSAISRMKHMELRFTRNPKLKVDYHKFMQEYLDLGHMTLIPEHEIAIRDSKHFYLPHHAVVKEDSTTTKLRVVFDGSCQTSSKVSLNDNLMKGAVLQEDIFSLITRFRRHKYGLSADIEKMYRQILVHPEHRDYQRIIWRWDANKPMDHYRLNTVTYGTTAGSFLAIRALQEVANRHQDNFPRAAEIIRNDFYVDDLMTGSGSVKDLKEIQRQLNHVLSSHSLNLRKWTSNCREISTIQRNLEIRDTDQVYNKVLGIYWNPANDSFSFKVCLPSSGLTTKRKLLSDTARIFDPLGWLSPATITLKVMFQELWSPGLNVSWDDSLPTEIADRWANIRSTFHLLETIEIPRWLQTLNHNRNTWF